MLKKKLIKEILIDLMKNVESTESYMRFDFLYPNGTRQTAIIDGVLCV